LHFITKRNATTKSLKFLLHTIVFFELLRNLVLKKFQFASRLEISSRSMFLLLIGLKIVPEALHDNRLPSEDLRLHTATSDYLLRAFVCILQKNITFRGLLPAFYYSTLPAEGFRLHSTETDCFHKACGGNLLL
jgi:hypothetical protein